MAASSRLLTSFACLILGSISFAQAAKDVPSVVWSSPTVIDARPRPGGPFFSFSQYFADYHGRSLEMKEYRVGYGFNQDFSIWYAYQDYLAKGRSSSSRFGVSSDTFGLRYVVYKSNEGDGAVSLDYEGIRPGTAYARTSSATASYAATRGDTFSVSGTDNHGNNAQISYSAAKDGAGSTANVFNFGIGRDFRLGRKLDGRLQVHLIEQSYTDVVEQVNFELKTVFYGALGWNASPILRFEADAAFMPSGMPLMGGRFSTLSSFQLYRPGGAAEGLRHDPIGFASIRLVLHGKL